MAYTHIILEVHCFYGTGEQEENEPIPNFCKRGARKLGYHCIHGESMCLYGFYRCTL